LIDLDRVIPEPIRKRRNGKKAELRSQEAELRTQESGVAGVAGVAEYRTNPAFP
jgi:hypothetical protein